MEKLKVVPIHDEDTSEEIIKKLKGKKFFSFVMDCDGLFTFQSHRMTNMEIIFGCQAMTHHIMEEAKDI